MHVGRSECNELADQRLLVGGHVVVAEVVRHTDVLERHAVAKVVHLLTPVLLHGAEVRPRSVPRLGRAGACTHDEGHHVLSPRCKAAPLDAPLLGVGVEQRRKTVACKRPSAVDRVDVRKIPAHRVLEAAVQVPRRLRPALPAAAEDALPYSLELGRGEPQPRVSAGRDGLRRRRDVHGDGGCVTDGGIDLAPEQVTHPVSVPDGV